MGRNILKSSLQDASFSIVFQILFRCMTFVLNAFIIRHVGQNVLGIMNVRLLLLESTILFLSKEPFSKACLTNSKSHNWAQVINQIWLSVPLCGVLSCFLVYVWIYVLSPTEDEYTFQYQIGCYSIAFSCIISQISQCFTLVAQSYCFVKLRVVIDTFHIVIRTIVFVIIVVYYPKHAINAFSIAQIVSIALHITCFIAFFWWYIAQINKYKKDKPIENDKGNSLFKDMNDFQFESITDFLPGFMKNNDKVLSTNLCILTMSFIKQCMVKQLLTEGERYVMSISPVLTFSQQSMYDIVNNLGSLAARFIFRPIEESSYFYFTQMLKRDEDISKQDQKKIQNNFPMSSSMKFFSIGTVAVRKMYRKGHIAPVPPRHIMIFLAVTKSVGEAVLVLKQLCKVVTSIGLVVVVFGQAYSESLLYLYGGTVLTSETLPTTLLKCHCFAVLLLAVNGVTECYVFATMNNKQLDRYNYIMVIFSVVFLIISFVLTYIIGPVGFIIANCVNMLARITHSVYFIHAKYKKTRFNPLEGLIPNVKFLMALTISGFITRFSELYLYQQSLILHIGVGGVCFLVTLAMWAMENKDLLQRGVLDYKRRLSVKVD